MKFVYIYDMMVNFNDDNGIYDITNVIFSADNYLQALVEKATNPNSVSTLKL